jgi:nucleotide-binding universal stress UspA family protein
LPARITRGSGRRFVFGLRVITLSSCVREILPSGRRTRIGEIADARSASSLNQNRCVVFLNILVGLDGSPASKRALEHAVELARAGNARLTMITVAPQASSLLTLAGVSGETMQRELDAWAESVLRESADAVPEDDIAHSVRPTGDAGREVVAELERGGYDLVVLGARGRGRAQEGLLGSVNGYVHFHSKVPILSIPAPQH